MTQAITYASLVTLANQTFPGFGISEISTGCEGFDDENEVVTMSMYELPAEVREWIKTQISEMGISEKVFCIVSSSDNELTCLDVVKIIHLHSGTNLILQNLAKSGLINERIERNGTRRYSAAA